MKAFYLRYKDFILLLAGFVLTGIIGTAITDAYQERQIRSNSAAEQLRVEREAAMTTVAEISQVIGKHHFNALQLRGAIDEYLTNPTDENLSFLQEQSTQYRSGLQEWNTTWNRNRSGLRMFFGTDLEGKFYTHSDVSQQRYEQSITGLFNTMHIELVQAKAVALSTGDNRAFSFTRFDAAYHAIGYLSYELYNEMTRQIQNGHIGTFSPKPVEDLAPTYAFPSPIPAQ